MALLPIIFNDTLLQCYIRALQYIAVFLFLVMLSFDMYTERLIFLVLVSNPCANEAVLILVIERNLIYTFESPNLFCLHYASYIFISTVTC